MSADESQLGRLDSSVKKNGTFIKKLRQLGSDNGKQLLAEATKLNLSKVCGSADRARGGGGAVTWLCWMPPVAGCMPIV